MASKKSKPKKGSFRNDGWVNIFTNLGKAGKDKRTGSKPGRTQLDKGTLETIYQCDDIAAKIIDRPPMEMLREGFCLNIPEDKSKKKGEAILERGENFDLKKKLELGMRWSRLYGGSAILVGIKGQKPETPIRPGTVEYLTVLDRHRLSVSGSIQLDVTKSNFGLPEFYTVSSSGTSVPRIHHSRVIRFQGSELPYDLMHTNDYWGDPVLNRLFNVLRNFNTGHDSAATLLTDFSQAVFKMKDLASIISSEDGDTLIEKRLQLVSLLSSVINAVVVEEGEEYERKTTSVAGLPDMLDRISRRLVAATDMPHTVLLGESPSGLGATGNSEMTHWYDHLASEQNSKLKPPLIKLMDIFFSEPGSATKGKIPKKYDIVFNPLWQMDDKQLAEIRKSIAETDGLYIDRGVYDPNDVAKSRFSGTEFGMDIKIDWKAREAYEEQQKKGTQVEDPEGEAGRAGEAVEEGEDDAGDDSL